MERKKTPVNWALYVGIFAMLLLVAGTMAESGSFIQKIMFVIGAPALGITAWAGKQQMFTVLQIAATLGAVLAFFPSLPEIAKYGLMGTAAAACLAYLAASNYFNKDTWGLFGSAGLISISLGFATDPISSPFLFGAFLGFGGFIVAAYSAISFFHYRIKIALIWLILNVIFGISPILIFIRSF